MLAGGGDGTLKSVNGGKSWFSEADLGGGGRPQAIAFQPDNANVIYAGVEGGWGLYK